MALAVSLEHYGDSTGNDKAKVLADSLNAATEKLLDNKKSPLRKVGELDNRGSHFYLAMYWAEALALQNENHDLKMQFTSIAKQLLSNEKAIVEELTTIQGVPVNIGGYYKPNDALTNDAMKASKTLNDIIKTI